VGVINDIGKKKAALYQHSVETSASSNAQPEREAASPGWGAGKMSLSTKKNWGIRETCMDCRQDKKNNGTCP